MRVQTLVIDWIKSLARDFFGAYKIEDPTNLAPMDLASRSPAGTKTGMSRPTVAGSDDSYARQSACHQFNCSRCKLRSLARIIHDPERRPGLLHRPKPSLFPCCRLSARPACATPVAAFPAPREPSPRHRAQAGPDCDCGRSISCARSIGHLGAGTVPRTGMAPSSRPRSSSASAPATSRSHGPTGHPPGRHWTPTMPARHRPPSRPETRTTVVLGSTL